MGPVVPKNGDKPIHGLVSDKNFIVANAVENILAAPKLPAGKDKDYLKKKWEELHHKFQKESIHSKLDTLGKKNRKENLEKEMDQVEADIKKLSKNYIFVDTTAPS